MNLGSTSATVAAILVATATGVTALDQVSARGSRARRRLKHDLELLALMPDAAKEKWAAHVDAQIDALIREDRELRRDPFGIVLGLVFMSGGVAAGFAAHAGTWSVIFWPVAAASGLVGLVGFTIDVTRKERDDRGRPIKQKPDDPG